MNGDTALRHAAALMAARLKVFRKTAELARERGDLIELDPCELWESADDAALAAYEKANNEINGARPLPMEISA